MKRNIEIVLILGVVVGFAFTSCSQKKNFGSGSALVSRSASKKASSNGDSSGGSNEVAIGENSELQQDSNGNDISENSVKSAEFLASVKKINLSPCTGNNTGFCFRFADRSDMELSYTNFFSVSRVAEARDFYFLELFPKSSGSIIAGVISNTTYLVVAKESGKVFNLSSSLKVTNVNLSDLTEKVATDDKGASETYVLVKLVLNSRDWISYGFILDVERQELRVVTIT